MIDSETDEILWLLDSVGLKFYLRTNGEVYVAYPFKTKQGSISFGAGFRVEFPDWYFTTPPNEITRERAEIVRKLKEDYERKLPV